MERREADATKLEEHFQDCVKIMTTAPPLDASAVEDAMRTCAAPVRCWAWARRVSDLSKQCMCMTAKEPVEATQRCAYLGVTPYSSNSSISAATVREVHTAARKAASSVAGEEKVPRLLIADSQ